MKWGEIMSEICIDVKKVDDKKIIYKLQIPKKLKKYFQKSKFYIEFEHEKVNLKYDNPLLTVPAVSIVFPIALVSRSEIYVDFLDKNFLQSLKNLAQVIKKMYPAIPDEVLIHTDTLNCKYLEVNSLAFYSGGLDSTHLLYTLANKKPYLATILGSDIKSKKDPIWKETKNLAIKANRELNCRGNIFVYFDNPLDNYLLSLDFENKMYGNDWWGGIQAGITIPTLVAPISENLNLGEIYIASGLPERWLLPWSDRKEIYEQIKFGSAQVLSPDGGLTRLDKAKNLAYFILSKNYPKLPIRSCLNTGSLKHKQLNCGECEKCLRTSLELLIAKLEPNEFGFKKPTTEEIKAFLGIISKKSGFSEPQKLCWQEITSELCKVDLEFNSEIIESLNYTLKLNRKIQKPDFKIKLYVIFQSLSPLSIKEMIRYIVRRI
ncbi:MAG: hypothetical protein N3A69_05645 [Leptospiraceae bacterium]|nr:hypothetical protein [Leptospiraceae bacterium]